MPWTALFVCRRVTQPDSCPAAKEPGRHRRGEIISIKPNVSPPPNGFKHTHSQFTFIYITDIDDSRTLAALQERFLQPHEDDTDPDNPVKYGRKRVFIAVSDLAAPRRRRAWNDGAQQYQGWDDVTWNVFRNNWLKRRPANTVPRGKGNPADDDLDDADGISEIIT